MNQTEISFLKRHIGLNSSDIDEMLNIMNLDSIDELIEKVIPRNIYSPLDHNLIETNLSETVVLDKLREYSNNNLVFRSFIGMGYHGTIIPNVINIGGFHISSDIARGLSTSIYTAERLKILHGSEINPSDSDNLIDIPLTGNNENNYTHKIKKRELDIIISSRVQEILENIRQKTDKSIFEKKITNNIVLTGKTSELKGFSKLTSDFFGVKVRIGKPEKIKGLAESLSGPGSSVCCGLIKYKILKDLKNSNNYQFKNNLIIKKFGSWIKESFF